jgi:hypothetical protein
MSPKPFKLGDHCRAGHLLTEENTYTEGSRLRCLECLRIRKPLKGTNKKEYCINGHERTEENVNSYGACKICARERMAERRSNGLDPSYAGTGQGAHNSAKTHCPYGHEYTEENTYLTTKGSRVCRICSKENGKVQTIKKYSITIEEFEDKFQSQNGLCCICSIDLSTLDKRDIQIDHNHECCDKDGSCGKCVRGIICGECNRGLARFKDSSELIRRAADYLDVYTLPNPDQLTLF